MAEFRVLTVCTGNVHRSAFAAEMLRTWADWYLPAAVARDVTVTSAGTRAAAGGPMDPRLLAMLARLGSDGSAHQARQIRDSTINAADLVLTATRSHRDAVLSRVPSAMRRTFTIREAGRIADVIAPVTRHDIHMLRSLVAALADRRHEVFQLAGEDDDIADPEGQGEQAFARMVRAELPALVSFAVPVFGMPMADAEAYLAAINDPEVLGIPSRDEHRAGSFRLQRWAYRWIEGEPVE